MDKSNQIQALNPWEGLLIESHYHSWLVDNHTDHAIQDKTIYLAETCGFMRGTDKIDEKTMKTLKAIENNFYFRKFREKECLL